MSYHEQKERLKKLQNTEFAENPDKRLYELEDLAEDILADLLASERSLYLLKRSVPPEISSYYPRITKDPTISYFKNNHYLVGTQSLENPYFTKLYELGLYVLSEGDYCIRTRQQLSYISKFIEGKMKEGVGIEGYHYEINFD